MFGVWNLFCFAKNHRGGAGFISDSLDNDTVSTTLGVEALFVIWG